MLLLLLLLLTLLLLFSFFFFYSYLTKVGTAFYAVCDKVLFPLSVPKGREVRARDVCFVFSIKGGLFFHTLKHVCKEGTIWSNTAAKSLICLL